MTASNVGGHDQIILGNHRYSKEEFTEMPHSVDKKQLP